MPDVPATAKKPADRKPKGDPDTEPIKVKLGAKTYTIDSEARDDLEVIELLQDGRELPALRQLLGLEQWNEWKDSIRTKGGRVSATKAREMLDKLVEAAGLGN